VCASKEEMRTISKPSFPEIPALIDVKHKKASLFVAPYLFA
jgi:hypothetical protein